MTNIEDLKLRFLGSLVEQLGAQLYPSATATIAELISNAWDADSRNVWVNIPLDTPWTKEMEILVTDDGIGMSHEDARDGYLLTGRKRRKEAGTDRSPSGRLLHGRKGIGKLAAFGTAHMLDLSSLNEGQETRFRLDYNKIRTHPPGSDCPVELSPDHEPLTEPDGTPLEHGTRIRLSHLTLRRALNSERFLLSLSRRFAINAGRMRIFVNAQQIRRFDYDVEFRFPRDGRPKEAKTSDDGWALEYLPSGKPLRWWIGFTEKPLKDQTLQGISVLARDKMVQRPFLFQRSQGTQGQLGQEYIVGEITADWLDQGFDIDTDHIQANRDQLQLEDDELDEFIRWGQSRLRWALTERNKLRVQKNLALTTSMINTDDMLSQFTPDERRPFVQVATTVSRIPEISNEQASSLMQAIVDARSDVTVRQMWQEISVEMPDIQSKIWNIIHRFGLIDARRNQTMIEARLNAIDQLKRFIYNKEKEIPTIHNHVKQHPWLIDPRWHLLDDEVDLKSLDIPYELDTGAGRYLDYLFALRAISPTTHDEIVIVEIKRGTNPDGSVRAVDAQELQKFQFYVVTVAEHYRKSSNPPRVSGRMIAQRYTGSADPLRRTLERNLDTPLEFHTWDQVIEGTERLHRSWLAVESRRASDASQSPEQE